MTAASLRAPESGSRSSGHHRITLDRRAAVLAIARDVSERRRPEAELERYRRHLEERVEERTYELQEAYRQIERNIEQFATLADHIRHPLQVILGMSDLIEHEKARIIEELDKGWIESEKIRAFLKRYSR